MEVADFKVGVTLPASEDCFFINVVSKKETRYPADQCAQMKKRGLVILSEDYKILRQSVQKNCQMHQCKQLVGAFDELFIQIDKGLQLVPLP